MSKILESQPSSNHQTTRYFNNPILEQLAYTNSLTVNLIFIPITLAFAYLSIARHTAITILFGFILGLFLWTFIEYVMHRFAFHFKFHNKTIKSLHAIFHLSHHQYPNDKRKYQTLILLSLPSGIVFYFIFKYLFGTYIEPIFTGFILGYVLYEFTHYSTHKFKMDSKFTKSLKQHHMYHHFLHQEKNYGVTSAFWDIIFKTRLTDNERLLLLQKKAHNK